MPKVCLEKLDVERLVGIQNTFNNLPDPFFRKLQCAAGISLKIDLKCIYIFVLSFPHSSHSE